MEIDVVDTSPAEVAADVLAFAVPEPVELPAAGQELAELIDQRCRRRVDVSTMQAKADHAARALGNAGEAESIVALDLVQRNAVDRGDFRRVRHDRRSCAI